MPALPPVSPTLAPKRLPPVRARKPLPPVVGSKEPPEESWGDWFGQLGAGVVGGGLAAAATTAGLGALGVATAPFSVPLMVAAGAVGGVGGGLAARAADSMVGDDEAPDLLSGKHMVMDAGLGVGGAFLGPMVGAGVRKLRGSSLLAPKSPGLLPTMAQLRPEQGAKAAREGMLSAIDDVVPGYRAKVDYKAGIDKIQASENPFFPEEYERIRKILDKGLDEAVPHYKPSAEKPIGFWGALKQGTARNLRSKGSVLREKGRAMIRGGSPEQGKMLEATGNAIEISDQYARQMKAGFLRRAGAIAEKVPKDMRDQVMPNWRKYAMGEMGTPDELERLRPAFDDWDVLQDEMAFVNEIEGVMTKMKGKWVPFKRIAGRYVPRFEKIDPAKMQESQLGRTGTGRGLGQHSRVPNPDVDIQFEDDFFEVVRRQAARDSQVLANAALAKNTGQSLGNLGGEQDVMVPGLFRTMLDLMRETGTDPQAAEYLADYLQKVHTRSQGPLSSGGQQFVRDFASSIVLVKNWTIQATEVSKAIAFSGGPRDLVRGIMATRANKAYGGILKNVSSRSSDIHDITGRTAFPAYDPRFLATVSDKAARTVGSYSSVGMVKRVSEAAALASTSGKKMSGRLLREASEIAPAATREESVEILARIWKENGGSVPADVMREYSDRLTGRWYYNFDPSSTGNAMDTEIGKTVLAYRQFSLRAMDHFKNDIYDPIRHGVDASERALGVSRFVRALGGNLITAAPHRAIRLILGGKLGETELSQLAGQVGQDALSSVGGVPFDAAIAVTNLASRMGTDGMDDAAEALNLSPYKGEGFFNLLPATQIAGDVLGDLGSGEPLRTLKGATAGARGLGAVYPPLKGLTALGHIPDAVWKKDD